MHGSKKQKSGKERKERKKERIIVYLGSFYLY